MGFDYKNFHGKVTRVSRLNNSYNGNPRWSLTLGELGRFVTPTDAGWVYGVNFRNLEGQPVFVTVGARKNSRTIESINFQGKA